MNRYFIATLLIVFSSTFVFSQKKYAYVDTEYILDNIPEYLDAQNQLDDLAEEYQEEIEEKYAEIQKMLKTYQAEAVLMPEDIKKKKQDEIIAFEKQVKDLQNQRFGKDGDLFLKREELVKPIQEKIYNAIEDIATEKNYAFVFDKAGSLTILYVNANLDISDDVLDAVGGVLGTVRKEDRKRNDYQGTPEKTKQPTNKSPQRPGGRNPGPIQSGERK
ncbi:MAG: OmpH family outer membrane protein [Bacteroidales bacterium]|nr:OmpH family outer membrane protein [Bacteroidales bacterium]